MSHPSKLLCSLCKAERELSEFSKKQRKASASKTRKCRECVQAAEASERQASKATSETVLSVRCCICHEKQAKSCFTKSQLSKTVEKRKCKTCTATTPTTGMEANVDTPGNSVTLKTSDNEMEKSTAGCSSIVASTTTNEEQTSTNDTRTKGKEGSVETDSSIQVASPLKLGLSHDSQAECSTSSLLKCSTCKEQRQESMFSKKQLRKMHDRVCLACQSQSMAQAHKPSKGVQVQTAHPLHDSDDATVDSHDLSSHHETDVKAPTATRQPSPVSVMDLNAGKKKQPESTIESGDKEDMDPTGEAVDAAKESAMQEGLKQFLEKFYYLHFRERLENVEKYVNKRVKSYWYRAEELKTILRKKLKTRKSSMAQKLRALFDQRVPQYLDDLSDQDAFIAKMVDKWHFNPDIAYGKVLDIAKANRARKARELDQAAETATHKKLKKLKDSESAARVKRNCDRCDGNHDEASCPYYRKSRDKHPDAQRGKSSGLGSSGGNFFIPTARVIRQPGDGNCLFHSLRHGLGYRGSTSQLRKELLRWVQQNQHEKIADSAIKKWVKWDSGTSVEKYTSRMSHSGWGGGIEMAACSRRFNVNVHVYEQTRSGFKRISCFDVIKGGASETVHVLYQGGVHYDALVPTSKGVTPKWAVRSGGVKFGKKRPRSNSVGSDRGSSSLRSFKSRVGGARKRKGGGGRNNNRSKRMRY